VRKAPAAGAGLGAQHAMESWRCACRPGAW